MNSKRVIVIFTIISSALIGIILVFYLWNRSKIIPDLIGGWGIDVKATKAYQQELSVTPDWFEEEISYWVNADTRFYYNNNGRGMLGLTFPDQERMYVYYEFDILKEKDGNIKLQVHIIGSGNEKKVPFKIFRKKGDTPTEQKIIILSPSSIAFYQKSKAWLVLKKVEEQ